MEEYRLERSLLCDSSQRLEVFEGFSKRLQKSVFIKIYHRSEVEELDSLFKAAMRRVRIFQPQGGALYAMLVAQQPSEQSFQVNWILEKQGEFADPALSFRDEVDIPPPGSFFERQVSNHQDSETCSNESTHSKTITCENVVAANPVIGEVLTQTRVEHPNTVKIFDVRVALSETSQLQISVLAEQVAANLSSEITRRGEHNQRCSEAEIVKCLLQLAAGLVYAKFRKTAHGSIQAEHVFVGLEGQYKLGHFGLFCPQSQHLREHSIETAKEDAYQGDVYSLGLTALHLACLEVHMERLQEKVGGLCYSQTLKDILRSMLSTDAHFRPTIEEVRAKLLAHISPVHAKVRSRDPSLNSRRGKRDEEVGTVVDVHWSQMRLPSPEMPLHREQSEKEPLVEAERACLNSLKTSSGSRSSSALNTLCGIYLFQGRLAEAEQVCVRDVAVLRKAFGEEHAALAASYGNLSTVYLKQGKLREAERTLLLSLHIKLKAFADTNFSLATSFRSLSRIQAAQGRLAEAEEAACRALFLAEVEMPRASAALERFRSHLRKIQVKLAKNPN